MLPYPSTSAWVLIFLLIRWATCKPRKGGMSNDRHKAACLEFLAVIWKVIKSASAPQPVKLMVELSPGWCIPWPRPRCCQHRVILAIDQDGHVDMKSFIADLCSKVHAAGLRKGPWWSSADLRKMAEQPDNPSWIELLERTSSISALHPLHCQILWMLGSIFQQGMMHASEKTAETTMSCTSTSGMDSSNAMDYQLVNYEGCCREAAAGCYSFSMATDKAAVGGLGSGVQSSVIVKGNTNQAIFPCPQASTLLLLLRASSFSIEETFYEINFFWHKYWVR